MPGLVDMIMQNREEGRIPKGAGFTVDLVARLRGMEDVRVVMASLVIRIGGGSASGDTALWSPAAAARARSGG